MRPAPQIGKFYPLSLHLLLGPASAWERLIGPEKGFRSRIVEVGIQFDLCFVINNSDLTVKLQIL